MEEQNNNDQEVMKTIEDIVDMLDGDNVTAASLSQKYMESVQRVERNKQKILEQKNKSHEK